jgi:proline iminopeptidase
MLKSGIICMKLTLFDHFDGLRVARYALENPVSSSARPCILYVHGGPGSHPGDFEDALFQLPQLAQGVFDWIVYDQRGCGRSRFSGDVTHDQNIVDLAHLCVTLPRLLDGAPLVGVFGHSYGARLAFETFLEHPEINLKLLLAGRAIQSEDSMNLSALMDLYILRATDKPRYREAYTLVAACEGNVSHVGREIRELFADDALRQRQRQHYYWGNLSALDEWKTACTRSELKDNDDIFYSVSTSIRSRPPRVKIYDPSFLKQKCRIILGFWDFMMAGATKPPIDEVYVEKFNGSGHYPHFEEPEKFMNLAKTLFLGDEVTK